MKKIYTLFAFAALCVWGCTDDVAEGGNASAKYNTVTLEAVAQTDDDETRALFDESGKKLVWDLDNGEQNLSVIELQDSECTNGLNGRIENSNAANARTRTGEFNAEKTSNTTHGTAIFDVSLLAGTADSYSYLAAYPNEALVAFATGKTAEMTLPAAQKPSAFDNLDPKATLLFAVDDNGGSGYNGARPYNLDLKFCHVASYAKMTIKNLPLMKAGATLEGDGHASQTLVNPEVVDHIVFTADDEQTALAGVYSYNYSDKTGSAANGKGVNSVTLDVKHLGIDADKGYFTVCFAVLPAKFTGFTVKVVTTEGHVYTKTFSGSLEFTRAHVKPFGLNFNGVAPEEAVYLKAYKELNGIPEGGFDSNKKYLIAAHGEKDTYTLRNDKAVDGEKENCTADNLETSGFVVITEGEGNNVDHPYMLYKEDETAEKYVWTLTGSGNNNYYTISNGNLGWAYPSNIMYYGVNLYVKESNWSTWEFSFGHNDFTIKTIANGDFYVNADTLNIKWVITGYDTSTIDIYEDNSGYYWAPASKETQVVNKYYKQVSTFKSGSNTYIGPFDASKTYIITLKDTATNDVYIIGNSGHNVATLNKFDEHFTWDSDHSAYKGADDDFYFYIKNTNSGNTEADITIGGGRLVLNSGKPEISVTASANVVNVFFESGGYARFRNNYNGANYFYTITNGEWKSWNTTGSSGSVVTVYERTE